MDLIKVFQRFPDHASCIEHLERVRWPHVPACPLCGAVNVARKAENDRIGRWNCRELQVQLQRSVRYHLPEDQD